MIDRRIFLAGLAAQAALGAGLEARRVPTRAVQVMAAKCGLLINECSPQ